MKKKPPVRDDVPWVKRQEIPDPQILGAASQYAQACRVLVPQTGVLLPLMNVAVMAVELYLKALSAEMIHVKDELMPDVSRVYAEPRHGHELVPLLDVIPDDVRTELFDAFEAELGRTWGVDLGNVLKEFDGALISSRYPFEYGVDITEYNSGRLVRMVEFLSRFVERLLPREYIVWKAVEQRAAPDEQSAGHENRPPAGERER